MKNLAESLAKSQRGILRVAQHDNIAGLTFRSTPEPLGRWPKGEKQGVEVKDPALGLSIRRLRDPSLRSG